MEPAQSAGGNRKASGGEMSGALERCGEDQRIINHRLLHLDRTRSGNRMSNHFRMLAEGKSQLVRYLRPELAQHVPSNITGHAEANPVCRGTKSPRISGMIKVAERLGRDRPHPL